MGLHHPGALFSYPPLPLGEQTPPPGVSFGVKGGQSPLLGLGARTQGRLGGEGSVPVLPAVPTGRQFGAGGSGTATPGAVPPKPFPLINQAG